MKPINISRQNKKHSPMKYILFLFLIAGIVGCGANGASVSKQCSLDSTWDRFDYSDTSKVYVDSSGWVLWKVDSQFHYYRTFSYQCVMNYGSFIAYCAAAHMYFESGISRCLLSTSKLSDTITQEVTIYGVNLDTPIQWKERWLGFRRIKGYDTTLMK